MIRAKKHQITAPVLIVWVLLGLLLSMAAIQFRLSGGIRLDKFYNTGIRYTVRYAETADIADSDFQRLMRMTADHRGAA